jgi:hypothetical protein
MKLMKAVTAATLLLAAGLPATLSPAQPPAAAAPAQLTIDQYAANALVRLALFDLRALDEPQPRDYALALAILDQAQTLAPSDAEIARRRIEAAWNAADQDALLAATGLVVRLDPKDTVATLRLLTARIGMRQTIDERLAMYDAFLGPQGQVLDPSIRSRLALDAAMLLRERQDQAGYMKRLKEAVQLDVTNKEAAYLAAEAVARKVDDPQGRLELLSNLLMADPLDPRVIVEVRDAFAAGGACKAASRFHDVAAKILRAGGNADDAELDLINLILQWRVQGPRAALTLLQTQLNTARKSAESQPEKEGGFAFKRRAEDMRLAISFEEVRLGTSIVLGEQAEVSNSLSDLASSIQGQTDLLRDRARRPANVTDEQVENRVGQLADLAAFWHAVVSAYAPGALSPAPRQTDVTVQPEPNAPRPVASTPPPTATNDPAIQGWQAIEAGDLAKARTSFQAAEDQDDPWVLLGLAALAEKADPSQAIQAYHKVATTVPLTAVGAIASFKETEAIAKAGANPATAPSASIAAALESFSKTIPSWIDGMVDRPWTFQSIRVEAVDKQVSPGEPVLARVRLRNLSPIPLALGAGKCLNTRLLFVPSIEAGGRVRSPEGEVIDVSRRLRLMPGEELECLVWPEAGASGYSAEQASTFPTRVSWRILQGFEAQADNSRSAGVGCVEVRSESVLHEAVPEVKLSPQELAAKIAGATDAQLPRLLLAARIALARPDAAPILADALAAGYSRWTPAGRMAALAALPPSAKVPALKAFDAQVAKETDPKALTIAALARPANADDPILATAAAVAVSSNSVPLANLVKRQQERMRAGVKTYSQIGVPEPAEPPANVPPKPAAPAPAPATAPAAPPPKP